MNTSDIVLAIDAEIAQLQKVKVLLTGVVIPIPVENGLVGTSLVSYL
ncbi:MAG TPA: hypothetical protein VK638_29565 [Edaphobacter sp.]|nr:hypothetical protein [Edaphobacter sp.]